MTSKTLFKNPEDWISWLASTGYLFPRNELELARYNKLYQDSEQIVLTNSTVSVERILAGRCRLFPASNPFEDQDTTQIEQQYRMVARKGQGQLPDHIRAKMKKNEANDDNGLPKKED
jgi:hypothetical protein